MSADQPLAAYEVASGALRGSRLTLYANRLVQQGADAMELVPLAHLASVRVAFERDAAKLAWAVVLLVVALLLALISGPLQRWIKAAGEKFADPARTESLEGFLHGVFNLFGGLANLLPALAAALALGAVALLVFFWLGTTSLRLAFAATERVCAVRGRDLRLFDFAEALKERLAARKD